MLLYVRYFHLGKSPTNRLQSQMWLVLLSQLNPRQVRRQNQQRQCLSGWQRHSSMATARGPFGLPASSMRSHWPQTTHHRNELLSWPNRRRGRGSMRTCIRAHWLLLVRCRRLDNCTPRQSHCFAVRCLWWRTNWASSILLMRHHFMLSLVRSSRKGSTPKPRSFFSAPSLSMRRRQAPTITLTARPFMLWRA